jgi:RNA polymerase sigma-70 factor (ECF subfamily)
MPSQSEAEIVACIPSLRRYARGLVHDPVRADDLVQDTLERAWSRLSMWRRSGVMRAWLFGIMHNLFIDGVRSQRSQPEQSEAGQLPEPVERATQTDGLELRDVERILQRLPVDQRSVLLLVGVEEFSYQEVASLLGIPVGTVMSRLSRARERLRAELDGRVVPVKIQRVK